MVFTEFLIKTLLPFTLDYLPFVTYFGSIIIGNPFIIMISMMSGHGTFPFWQILLFVFLGNMTSDTIWFFIARTRWIDKFLAKASKKKLDKIIKKISKHHLMRFDFLVMLVASFVYGIETASVVYFSRKGMSYWRFLKIDLIPTFLWIFSLTGAGYLAGKGFAKASETFESFRTTATIFIVILVILYLVWILASKFIFEKKD